jgi:CDP-diacylglycerol--serine O-phosphatidyltransferase
MRHIPNIITLLNLASGFISIIFLLKGNPIVASWLILAAMIFDFLDGLASRILKAYSDLGKELDSLADLISFGAAPGLIMFLLLERSTGLLVSSDSHYDIIWKTASLIIPALIPVSAGLRLAKFNLDESQSSSFKGLPTPAAALMIISVVLSDRYYDSAIISHFVTSSLSLVIFTLVISGLMVSRIPMLSLKFTSIKFKGNESRYLLILCSVAFFIAFGFGSIPLIIPAYIIISVLSAFFK